jgi:hypothetical protein
MEFLVLGHIRPPPPATPITDYGIAERLPIIIVLTLNYAFVCVFLTSLQFLRHSAEPCALSVCDGDLMCNNRGQVHVLKRTVGATAELYCR